MSEQKAIYNAANPIAALDLLWSTLQRQPGVDNWSELVEAERVVSAALEWYAKRRGCGHQNQSNWHVEKGSGSCE